MWRYVPLAVFALLVLAVFLTRDAPPSCVSLTVGAGDDGIHVRVLASDDRELSHARIFVNARLYSVCPLGGRAGECNVSLRGPPGVLRVDAEVVDSSGKTDRCPARLIAGLGIKKLQAQELRSG